MLTWTFTVGVTAVTFTQQVGDDYLLRFDGKFSYTKDLVLGATTAAQNYIDIGAFDVDPLPQTAEFATSADRQTFFGLQMQLGTLASSNGLSYTVLLVQATRIEGALFPRCQAKWEQR